MTELWTSGAGLPQAFVRRAQRAEAAGFDGITIVDSQNLSGDCYIALAMAAAATSRITLGTGVTNPFTRHPAVTAGAIATVQAVSGGRAHLGIGRGDSALAHLGYAPAAPATLADYLRRLQAYLRGDEVPFDEAGDLARLRLAKQTFERIHDAYDMTMHSRSHTPQAAILDSAFAREFGIFGRPAHCIERLRQLVALGIERFVVVGPSRDADRAEIERAEHRFATEVMPALRE